MLTNAVRWFDRNKRLFEVAGFICVIAVGLQWAGLIHLPKIIEIPVWIGIGANALRWTLWEPVVKPALLKRAGIEPLPPSDREPRRREARARRRSSAPD
jgi:hypothetical protein